MVDHGHIKNGVVILDEESKLPEGAEVEVVLPKSAESAEGEEQIPTLYERFKDIIGIIDDLPEDFAAQHDHYIHGTPKR